MSSVKIQGNATGTGIVTLAAPNTNTDITLTLPDGAGTLARTVDVPTTVPPTVQVFTASGTWTKPAGCKTIKVIVTGGGGGTVNSADGAPAGGTAIKYIDVTAISSVSVTVGSGGTSGAGGTSSFGAHCSATGGSKGNSAAPGTSGVGTGGDINLTGGGGGCYSYHSVAAVYLTGSGGASYWGGNGGHSQAGQSYGAGSGGVYNNTGTLAGYQGVVYVEEYY